MRSWLSVLSVLLTAPFILAAAPVENKISLAELSPVELIQRVEKFKARADALATKRAQTKFLADIESLTSRLADTSDFSQVSETNRIEIVNAYESLRTRADGGERAGNKRICERVQRTGSHMGTTICMTQAERDRAKNSSQESMREIQRKTGSSPAGDR